jgi:hypothetical protein
MYAHGRGKSCRGTADHDHEYMVPDVVPGRNYEPGLQFSCYRGLMATSRYVLMLASC